MLYEPISFINASDRATVSLIARRHELEPPMVGAIIIQESGGNPFAVRYEPNYRWLWPPGGPIVTPRGVSVETERFMQMCSFGAMQIMGATARELGFNHPYLTVLCMPTEGVEWGCRYLASLRRRFGTDPQRYVSAYNAGSPFPGSTYVESVMRRYETLKSYEWRG